MLRPTSRNVSLMEYTRLTLKTTRQNERRVLTCTRSDASYTVKAMSLFATCRKFWIPLPSNFELANEWFHVGARRISRTRELAYAWMHLVDQT